MIEIGIIKNGRYRVDKVIGEGGTSTVYLVTDIRIGKVWALKEISKKTDLSYSLAEREIEMLKSISFPMFPRIIDAWQEKNDFYIVSDYVEGISLKKIITQKPITRKKCIEWGISILEGLEYLHGLSPPVLYLDLKPDNVLVCNDGTIRMVDFGIASTIEGTTLAMGTSGYSPPEQYGRGRVDVRSDIYAFGATYYALRTGRNPEVDSKALINSVNKTKILTSKEKSILEKCLAANPSDRYDSVHMVKHSLNQFKTNHFKSRKIFNFIEIIALIYILGVVLLTKLEIQRKEQEAAKDMINSANLYIVDDEYTSQGLKVITTFINSGCLTKETSEQFTMEVARNYFEVQQNYKEALLYFNKLDERKYPEVKYYKELCRLEMKFDFDEKSAISCVSQFYRDIENSSASVKKYEDILFISKCYEKYEVEKGEGIRKSITVLEGAREDLENACKESGSDEYKRIYEKYNNRLELLYLKASRARI